MAASTTKPSPTSKPVQATSIDSPEDRKMPPVDDVHVHVTDPVEQSFNDDKNINETNNCSTNLVATLHTEPTYQSSESSYWYVSGKKFLEDGDFESGLQIIEEGIDAMKEMIANYNSVNKVPPVAAAAATVATVQDDNDEFILHESMAPLHYLYGTTLLYSIEESDFNQAMTIGGQVPVQLDSTVTPDDENNNDDEEYYDEDNDMKVASNNENEIENQYSEEDGGENQQPVDDGTDDIQIAWENLDLARTIIEGILSKQNESTHEESFLNKLRADLAQVYLREADLQKMNNKYEECIADYSRCLELLQTDGVERKERKIADVHYNLGLTYFLHVTATMSSSTDEDNNEDNSNRQLSDDDKEKLNVARSRGFYHYVACAMTLGGIIAEHCGVRVSEFIDSVLIGVSNMKGSSDDGHDCMEDPKIASLKVNRLREKIQTLPSPSIDVQEKCDALKELLDEIQETIDNAEQSERGVQEVTAMKVQIARAVADQTTTENETDDSTCSAVGVSSTMPTTTIGFGNGASDTAVTATAVPVTATLQVRKKAKRQSEQVDTENEGEKRLKITE
jgi:tetratricopeptide (TPR) repeat protein